MTEKNNVTEKRFLVTTSGITSGYLCNKPTIFLEDLLQDHR